MSRLLAGALGAVAVVLAVGLAVLLLSPLPAGPPGPEPGRSLYRAHCGSCHGADGRGRSWRSRLLLLRPGDLTSPKTAALPAAYLADLIRHGGATVGRPGMPAFGFLLTDPDIQALIEYVRALGPGQARAPGS